MTDKVNLITIGAGYDDRMRTLPVHDAGVVIDAKAQEAVLLLAPPASYRLGQRISPFERVKPIAAHFAGDGEALVFSASEDDDFRESEEWEEETEPGKVETLRKAKADERLWDLEERFAQEALMQAREDRQHPAAALTTSLMTLTLVTVLLVMLLFTVTVVNRNGGLGATLFGPAEEAPASEVQGEGV